MLMLQPEGYLRLNTAEITSIVFHRAHQIWPRKKKKSIYKIYKGKFATFQNYSKYWTWKFKSNSKLRLVDALCVLGFKSYINGNKGKRF